MNRKILFLDRDGTLIREPADFQIDSLEKLDFLPHVIGCLRQLQLAGYYLVIVSNQDGLGEPHFPRERFDIPNEKMLQVFRGEGVEFDAVLVDHHHEHENHPNRKPNTGMVLPYLAQHSVDLRQCFMIGDRKTDALLAANLGIRSLTIKDALSNDGDKKTGHIPESPTSLFTNWTEMTRHILAQGRSSAIHRQTKETDVRVSVTLHGKGEHNIHTGLKFFDHMLEQLAVHSGMDINIATVGDLDVDEHHTVEDTAIALGQALKQAVGDKRGLQRYGFVLPMDESEAHCSLDFSGRPYLKFKAKFTRERVGELPTELVEHFFYSLVMHSGLTLHLKVKGDNDHHQIEALFKATARAIRMALADMGTDALPSSKGTL
jgi:imidazoleglycerol-phosphate dehydratase / histidinol-phosphatase